MAKILQEEDKAETENANNSNSNALRAGRLSKAGKGPGNRHWSLNDLTRGVAAVGAGAPQSHQEGKMRR